MTTKTNEEKVYWETYNGTPKSVAREISTILKLQRSKPVVVLAGSQQFQKEFGHCVAIILLPTADGLRVMVKDPLKLHETRMKTIVYDFLHELPFHGAFQLFAELPPEEHAEGTECIRESLKIVGDLLDGKWFWLRTDYGKNYKPYLKVFSASRKREIT